MIVISDEIHAELVYPSAVHVPFASLGVAAESRTVTLTSTVKAFIWLACAAQGATSDRVSCGPRWRRNRPPCSARSTSSACTPRSRRGPTATNGWQGCAAISLTISGFSRTCWPKASPRSAANLRRRPTSPGWTAGRSAGETTRPRPYLARGGVELSGGPMFNPGGDGFARLNFATSRSLLQQILERMIGAVLCKNAEHDKILKCQLTGPVGAARYG